LPPLVLSPPVSRCGRLLVALDTPILR
jgi:hypothetical protein